MTSENFTSIVLTADEGYCLTQTADVELSDRVVATKVALSKHSTVDDWKEITKEEADQIIAEQNALREATVEK